MVRGVTLSKGGSKRSRSLGLKPTGLTFYENQLRLVVREPHILACSEPAIAPV
jgi:hypothetical protein